MILKSYIKWIKKECSFRIKKVLFFGYSAGKGKVHAGLPLSAFFNIAIWRRRFEAERFFTQVKKSELNGLYLFSLSRSGSHLFASQLHYHPKIFIFAEQLFNKTKDRQPYSGLPDKLHPVDFLLGSCFVENGIQRKDPQNLSVVGFMFNKYKENTLNNCISSTEGIKNSKFVFYFRNPFRVAISRHLFSIKTNRKKKKWTLNKSNFVLLLCSFARLIKKAIETKAHNEQSTFIIFHEIFCLESCEICHQVFEYLEFSESEVEFETNPRIFFHKSFWSSGSLVEQNKKLICENTGKVVYGAGGKFDPLTPPNLERTMKADVKSIISPELLDEAYRILPKKAVDFFLNDNADTYNSWSNEALFNYLFEEWTN